MEETRNLSPEEVLKKMKGDLEEACENFKFEFAQDSLESRINSMNQHHAQNLKFFIDFGLFSIDIDNRKIQIRDFDRIIYLVFYPCLHPEVGTMDADDWFIVEDDNGETRGRLQFNGLPEYDPRNIESIRLGYCMSYIPNDPVRNVVIDIVLDEHYGKGCNDES